MIRKSKTGRRAGESDRKLARDLIELYRLAQESPNGRHCLNPEGSHDEQVFIDANDPQHLLNALKSFEMNGTFAYIDAFGIDEMLLRLAYEKSRSAGRNYKGAISDLALEHSVSESVIERALRLASNRGAKRHQV